MPKMFKLLAVSRAQRKPAEYQSNAILDPAGGRSPTSSVAATPFRVEDAYADNVTVGAPTRPTAIVLNPSGIKAASVFLVAASFLASVTRAIGLRSKLKTTRLVPSASFGMRLRWRRLWEPGLTSWWLVSWWSSSIRVSFLWLGTRGSPLATRRSIPQPPAVTNLGSGCHR